MTDDQLHAAIGRDLSAANTADICRDTGAEVYQVEKPAPFSGLQSGEVLARWHDDDYFYKPSYGAPRERSGAAWGWALLVAILTLVGLAMWLVGRML